MATLSCGRQRGIESINLMARQINTLGNPALNLGADLQPLLIRDEKSR
jgi:hypothetical protein